MIPAPTSSGGVSCCSPITSSTPPPLSPAVSPRPRRRLTPSCRRHCPPCRGGGMAAPPRGPGRCCARSPSAAGAEVCLQELAARGEPMAVMAARLARDEIIPGLGHPLYPEGDPRAQALLGAAAVGLASARRSIESAGAAARTLIGQHPNIDFALATVTTALGLPVGAALSLFVVGRTVGWIAHAIEQYETGVLIRPRARYTGARPEGM